MPPFLNWKSQAHRLGKKKRSKVERQDIDVSSILASSEITQQTVYIREYKYDTRKFIEVSYDWQPLFFFYLVVMEKMVNSFLHYIFWIRMLHPESEYYASRKQNRIPMSNMFPHRSGTETFLHRWERCCCFLSPAPDGISTTRSRNINLVEAINIHEDKPGRPNSPLTAMENLLPPCVPPSSLCITHKGYYYYEGFLVTSILVIEFRVTPIKLL